MSNVEYIYKNLNTISFVFKGFLYVCTIILNFFVALVRRNKKIFDKTKSYLAKFFFSHEVDLSRKIQIHSFVIKHVAEKISKDRQEIEESTLNDYYYFQEQAFNELETSSIPVTLDSCMQQKYLAQNKQTKEILDTLERVKNDFSSLKSEFNRLFCTLNSESQQEISDSRRIVNVLTEAKKDFAQLISVNRSKRKEMLETVLRLLFENQSDIRKEVTLFSFVADCKEPFDEENSKLNQEETLSRIERMKKNFMFVCSILNRQYSEMEKLQQAVAHFSQRLAHFIVNLDRVWNQNKKSGKIYRQLEEADIASGSLAEKMDINVNSLIRQLKVFAPILSEVKNMLTTNVLNLDHLSPSIPKKLEECSLDFSNTADTVWINNVDVLNQKLENLLRVDKNSKEKLESVKRTSNHFENYYNLMKSMTRIYNTLLKFFLSALERSQKFHRAPKLPPMQNKEVVRNNIELFDKDNNCVGDVNVWDEVRSELDVKLKNVDINSIIFILKDIMRTTQKFFDEGQVASGDIHEANAAQSGDYIHFGDIPSESILTDVSSEFLVQNSDESTGELSEVTLE